MMEDLSFYDAQFQYQNRVGAIEEERLKLEREMFAMMKSDKRLQNLRTAKLRSYWQQVCEREKKARGRNEDLLQDFQNLEMKLAAMEAKTKKLRAMKVQYDEKVKQMYPKWRHEVEVARAKKQLQERGVSFNSSTPVKFQMQTEDSLPQTTDRTSEKKFPERNEPSKKEKPLSSSATVIATPPFASMEGVKQSLTSTPKFNAQEGLVSPHQARVHPPPDSFADAKPQETANSSHSPVSSPSRTVHVHTIPTAVLPQEGRENSDSSFASDNVRKETTSPAKSSQPVNTSSSSLHLRSREKSQGHDPIQSDHEGKKTSTQSYQESPVKDVGSLQSSLSNHKDDSYISPIAKASNSMPTSPEPRPSSKLSVNSFGSDELSPRSTLTPRTGARQLPEDQSLRDNAVYQAMLKQHGGKYQDSLKIPEMSGESDEDDLEDILSPHGTGKSQDQDESDGSDVISSEKNQNPKQSEPVYIPTALMPASSSTLLKQQPKSHDVPRAPWESDSDEEFGQGYTNLSDTGGSSKWDQKLKKYDPEDDYDFYD